ncbi:Helicase [Theobroma cacao]|nr:Helicase [Theobroma cacao]
MTEIQVRTLSNESTVITTSPEKTINDLKLLLKLSFPPASSSPNFHLFFKGTKLNLQSKVSSLSIQSGEFFVLIPFTKKDKPRIENPSFSNNASTATSFADSTYSDMMQEFSSLRDESGNFCEDNSNNNNVYFKSKRKGVTIDRDEKKEGRAYDFLWNVLRTSDGDLFEKKNCEKFVEVLRLVNCLSSPYSGKCMLLSEAKIRSRDEQASCLCPVWLKKIVEAFAFLSILSAFLQLRTERMTSACLKEVLERLRKFGLGVCMEDIECLSVLCPKVVCFVNNDMEPKNFGDALVITLTSTKEGDKVDNKLGAGKSRMSLSKIFSIMKKWESSFKTSLWETIKLLMSKQKYENLTSFSLEDLLIFWKEGDKVSERNETKRARRSWSSASNSHSVKRRCHDTSQLLPAEMVEHLRKSIGLDRQMVHVENIGARKASYVEIPKELSDNTKSALQSIGINKLYSHQAESIMASLSGKNVVVATMTSSGKSVCYNLPVLEALSHNLSSCALYLFPTKALAQDQLRALLAIINGFDCSINIGVYDGDTSQKERTWLRDNARLLITNPDMLHMSILPLHRQFSRILSNLSFVVVDEAHTYKGAFGCHTALILRRLCRLCSHVYGSDPSFVFSTATSANPREHCMELANLSTLELIENDGSPSSEKLFVLWNPALCLRTELDKSDHDIDARNASDKSLSPISEVSYLFAEMVQHGLRCIAFCRSRKLCELVLCYTREILEETAPHLVNSISAYRAGYVAEDRRKIESDFFGGKLCGIAATNALELGIDVGHIDVTLHLGFPGSIASLWQQAGRSGRRERPSLAVYVAFEGPLDQYFMKFPEKLFRSPIECCHIDTQNQQKMPSRSISIRAIEAERYVVIDTQLNETLEEIEESRAFFQVYEGAVYMHQGRTYLVKDLDLSRKIAYCEKAALDYYTKTRDYTDIHIIGASPAIRPAFPQAYPARISKDQLPRTTAQANTCSVTTTWFGFRRIRKGSNQILDTAVWISVPQSIKTVVEKKYSFCAGLHAACHAVLHVVPLCNLSDLAPECPNPHDTRFFPERILLYDQHPGGTGVSKQIQPYFTELLCSALELLTCCHCSSDSGCPNCVQNLACHEYNELINKDAAIMIIKGVLDAEKLYFEGHPDSTPSC